jgi:hypothetical protein
MRVMPAVSCFATATILRTALVATALGSLATAQTTRLVGPGQTYTTIGAAVAAANPGDTVLVLGGMHTAPLLINKGIRLVGQGGAAFVSEPLPFGEVRIQGVPASQPFAMSGFRVAPLLAGSLTPTLLRIVVENCAGPVSFEHLEGTPSEPYATWSLWVQNAAQVNVRASRFGSCWLRGSTTVLENCIGQLLNSGFVLAPLRVDGGTTLLVGGEMRGPSGLIAAAGVWLERGTLLVTRATIRGGTPTPATPSAPAIAADAGEVLLDPSAVLLPTGSALPIQGPAAQIALEFASSIVTLTPTQLDIHSHGPANVWFATMLSAPVALTPTPWGVSWVDPTAAALVVLAAYGPNREHAFTTPLPPLPPGIFVAVQPVVLAPTGFGLGAPSMLTTR